MKRVAMAILAITVLAGLSCKKDDNNGGSGQVSYRIKAANYTSSLASTTKGGSSISTANTITWTSGTMIVSEIDFEAKNKNVDIEYELKQVNTVDLFNLSPVLGSISIPAGTYEEVELKLDLKKTTSGPAALVLKGDYYDASGAKFPIEFSFNENIEIEVEGENLTVSSANYTGMINMQLNKLLVNVSASALASVEKVNGKIIVNGTTNATLFNKMKTNFNILGDCDFD